MSSIRLEVVSKEFHCFKATRVQQGEVTAGPEPQITLLRSCICVGFYDAEHRIGAISHITGFNEKGGHAPGGALREMRRALGQYGLGFEACECFVVGGSDAARQVYEAVLDELKKAGITYRELDVLGRFHRKLLFDPATGRLTLLKKSDMPTTYNVTTVLNADSTLGCFQNPKDRLLTGASLLFRNRAMLEWIRRDVLKTVFETGDRLHVWCAGCSIGMEVYSVAMVILDWLDTRYQPAKVMVLGTDISAEALASAKTGIYPIGKQGVRGYEALVARYTESIEGYRVRMGPELRKIVAFKQRDIRTEHRGHLFELVICDHVFQYFTEDVQREFVPSLVQAVRPGGFLYVSTPTHRVADMLTREYPLERVARHAYRLR